MPQTAQESFACPTMYAGFGSGSTEEYVIITNDTNESLPVLSSIDVKMTIGACAVQNHTTRRLAAAADNCAAAGGHEDHEGEDHPGLVGE